MYYRLTVNVGTKQIRKVASVVGVAVILGLVGCSKGSLTVTVVTPAIKDLSGANVTLSPQGKSGVTDFAGQAKFNDLDKGQTVVLVEKPGHVTKAVATEVRAFSYVTIQLASAKTTAKTYEGIANASPYSVTVPEASLSGNVVVRAFILWSTGQWIELPWTRQIAGTVKEMRAYIGEGTITLVALTGDSLTNDPTGLDVSYKIVVTIPPAGSPKKADLW